MSKKKIEVIMEEEELEEEEEVVEEALVMEIHLHPLHHHLVRNLHRHYRKKMIINLEVQKLRVNQTQTLT
jgi:hypothetical protein